MERIADALDGVNRAVGRVVRWAALAMVLLQFALVLARYTFGVSAVAANEAVLYLHAALFMLGAGYTLLVGGHVRVDVFYARLAPRARAAVDVFGHLALLAPATVALMWWSWPMVRRSWAIMEGPLSVGGIPAAWLLKSLVTAFCALLLVQGLACLLRDLVRLRRG